MLRSVNQEVDPEVNLFSFWESVSWWISGRTQRDTMDITLVRKETSDGDNVGV